jgi:hypothetical protein
MSKDPQKYILRSMYLPVMFPPTTTRTSPRRPVRAPQKKLRHKECFELTSHQNRYSLPKVSAPLTKSSWRTYQNSCQLCSVVVSPLFSGTFHHGCVQGQWFKAVFSLAFLAAQCQQSECRYIRVTTIAKISYDETVILVLKRTMLCFPIVSGVFTMILLLDANSNHLFYLRMRGSIPMMSMGRYVSSRVPRMRLLVGIIFGDKTLILRKIEKDSFEDYNFRFALFWKNYRTSTTVSETWEIGRVSLLQPRHWIRNPFPLFPIDSPWE